LPTLPEGRLGRACAIAALGLGLHSTAAQEAKVTTTIRPDHPRIARMGRFDRSDPARPRLGFPGLVIRVRFAGPRLVLLADDSTGQSAFDVIVDAGEPRVVRCEKGEHEYLLADDLSDSPHDADIVRRTETWQGVVTFLGLRLAAGRELLEPRPWPTRKLLFVGDSVTAGEGADREICAKDAARYANARVSYGMLLAQALGAQCQLVAFGGRGVVRDWQGRRDLLTAPQFFELALPDESTPHPPHFDLTSYVPDGVVVSLGTNDFNVALGAPPDRADFVGAYVRFVRRIRGLYPHAQVFLTEGAIVNDDAGAQPAHQPRTTLRSYLEETVRTLADPGVHDVPSTHYPGDACDAHPNKEQHRAMASDLEPVLRRALGW
jgi:lysophospholipase L1-like esterase